MGHNRRPGRHGASQVRPRWRVTLGDRIALGPGKADLLEAIARTGSISAAAAALGMSYRRAWVLADTMNACFAQPLVATSRERRKGATLTKDGRKVLRLYRRIEAKSLRSTHPDLTTLAAMLRRK
jgi:molybdate transport system regulatory protein